MKVKFSYRILFLVLVLAVLYFARPGNSFGQEPLPMDPLSPIGPKDYSECSSLQREWDNLYSQLDRMHEDCLESHRKNREKSNESGTGAGSRCAFPGCQSLHTRKYEVDKKRDGDVQACRSQVADYQRAERERKAEEERLRREQEEREEKRKSEEDRKKAEARDEAEQRKESARKTEDSNNRLLKEAAKQSQQRQEILQQNTELRKQQMEELKKQQSAADDRFNTAVEERTKKTQDELLNQIAANARPENSIFPQPSQQNAGNEDFDLSGINGRNDATSELPLTEIETAMAPEQNSGFLESFKKVRDVADRAVEMAREFVKDQAREIIDDHLKEITDDMLAGAIGDRDAADTLRGMAKTFAENNYKDPMRPLVDSAFNKTLGGPLNETTDQVASILSDHFRTGYGPLRGDGLVGAIRDVAIKTGVEKLADSYKKTVIDQFTTRMSEVYGRVSEKIFGPSDPTTRPVTDAAVLGLPMVVAKVGSPTAAIKAIHTYGTNLVNGMGVMFDNWMRANGYGTAPLDDGSPEP